MLVYSVWKMAWAFDKKMSFTQQHRVPWQRFLEHPCKQGLLCKNIRAAKNTKRALLILQGCVVEFQKVLNQDRHLNQCPITNEGLDTWVHFGLHRFRSPSQIVSGTPGQCCAGYEDVLLKDRPHNPDRSAAMLGIIFEANTRESDSSDGLLKG